MIHRLIIRNPALEIVLGVVLAMATGIAMTLPTVALAAGEVESIDSSRQPATPLRYDAAGDTYLWGAGENERIEGFNFLGNAFRFVNLASSVRVHYADGAVLEGDREPAGCYLFAEQDDSSLSLAPSFSSPVSSGCDLDNLFGGRTINRGSLDTFSNTNGQNDVSLPGVAGNVERIDILFERGIVTPVQPGLLASAGHAIAEMRGDNALQIAAIVSVDAQRQPSGFGALRRIDPTGCSDPSICFGTTFKVHNYSLLGSDGSSGPALITESTDAVAMAFVSVQDLGLNPGQTYFGFSLFAADVNASAHDLLEPQSFPDDTGNSADLYGGMGAYFLLGGTSVANANVFLDINADGIRDPGEINLPDVSLTLFADNFNGVFDADDRQVGETYVTDGNGNVFIPALPNGNYWLLLDETDPDLPAGFFPSTGSNPAIFTVSAGAFVSFALSQGVLNQDGSGFDGSDGDGTGGDGSGGDGSGGDGTGGDGTGFDGSDGDGAGGDATTLVATADQFTIAQGSVTRLDVLQNDIDAVGQGLTLVSVGSVQSGTAEIDEGTILFEPPHDFLGETGFVYTVQDAEGNLATAPVALTVVRFSDINGNGLNDFVECECDDIRLITGIDGTGTGGAPALVWLLGLMLLVRLNRISLGNWR